MRPDHERFLPAVPGDPVRDSTRLGLSLARDVDAATWSELVARLVQTAGLLSGHRDTLTAWLGDVLAYGAGKYRGQIAEYANAAGLSPGTLRDAKLVCSRIPFASRREELSWSHHCEIGKAFSTLREIEHWLSIAVSERLTTASLRKRIRAHLSQSRAPTNMVDVPSFRLLRDLRAIDRMLRSNRALWTAWTTDVRRVAGTELRTLAEFAATLKPADDTLTAAS
jgi:hypothetical protein